MDVVSNCERVAKRVARGMYFNVFSDQFKGKSYLKKIDYVFNLEIVIISITYEIWISCVRSSHWNSYKR